MRFQHLPKRKMRLADFFGKEYFDGGQDQTGRFSEYTLDSKYREFDFLTSRLNSMFRPRIVLDIGCAKGFLVLAFRNLGIESYGVDVSSYALSQAPRVVRRHLSEVDLNTQRLPFEDRTFDLITAMGVLEYVISISTALGEIRRVISENGILFVKTYYPLHAKKWMQPFFENVEPLELRDEKGWIDVLASHGFEFMKNSTDRCYPVYIQQWLEDALSKANGLKYSLGQHVYAVPKFGRWALSRWARSRVGMLFFKPR